MAATSQTLEQKTSDASNSPKNEDSTEELTTNAIVNNLKPTAKHETYQDGGRTKPGGNNTSDIERQRMNADYRHYNQNFVSADDFRSAQENHNANFCTSFGDNSNYLPDQHGGQGEQHHQTNPKMYTQYQARQTYVARSMNVSASQRPANAISSYPNSTQQRFLSGQSISQQGGPTPTLNQLLQSPNPLHRYQNHYGDYSTTNKGLSDSNMAFGNAASQHGWTSMRSPNSYQQQMYRNQGVSMSDPNLKRPFTSPGQQAVHQSNPQGTLPHGGAATQYSQQYVQRLCSQSQQQGSPSRPITPGYAQQLPAQYNVQQVSSNSQPPQGNFEQRPSSQMSFSQLQGQSSQEVASNVEDDPGGGGSGTSTPGLTRTPGTPPTSQGQPHRPPSGSSTGSRSMSPAVGQQTNIPMSPRPSSAQPENSIQSHMSQNQISAQNYSQQIAASSQFYSNKMHQGMSGSSNQMGQYSQQGHYPQGSYPRPQSTVGLQGYGMQGHNNFSTNPNYPSQTGAVRLPPGTTQNYPISTTASYMNSQYPGYGMMPPPSQYSKSAMLPPTNAQAAVQAAVVAAANTASMRSSPMYLRQHLQQKIYAGGYTVQQQVGMPNSIPGAPSTPSPAPCVTPNASQDDPAMLPAASTPSSSQHSSMSPPSVSTPLTETSSVVTSVPQGNYSTQTSAPSIGTTTSMTQSIDSPVSSAVVTVSSPVGESYPSQQALSSQKRMLSSGFQPPPVLDEGSQASNTSASSSLPEEHSTTPKPNSKATLSHPPTPNTLPSPGAASMSSFHDEFDSVSSPSWPRTPASPRPDGLLKLYDMSDEPDRRLFLDKLILYNEERGTPITQCPTISKQPLDLYRLYISAKERGGFVEVTKAKLWKDVAGAVGIGASSSAAYTLRKQYIKHLLPYECKFDRGGIDPQPIINQVESTTRKKGKNVGASHQEPYPQQSPNQMMDGYPHSNYPGPYSQAPTPHATAGMMPSGEYPASQRTPYVQAHHHGQMANHMAASSEPMNMQDPFTDEIQNNQYQRPAAPAENYSYSQSSINTMVPPYSATQASMSGGSYGYSNASIPQQEQYGEQYTQHPSMLPSTDSTYNSRSMVQEPCPQPPGGYPNTRPLRQPNASQYSYQGHCDRDRYEQPHQQPQHQPQQQQPQPPPPPPQQQQQPPPPQQHQQPSEMQPNAQMSSSVVAGGTIQQDPMVYQNQRFNSQPQMHTVPPRDTMTPQPATGYQTRSALPPNQYPGPVVAQAPGQGPYPQPQQDSYRVPEVVPPYQNYSAAQQNMYGPGGPMTPNKVAPPPSANREMYQRDMYSPASKHRMDFMKPGVTDQYASGNYNQPAAQAPYGDRSQYPYRSSHMMPVSGSPGMQQGWQREGQYRQYQGPIAGPYSHPQRDTWDGSRPDGPNQWSHYPSSQSDSYPHHMGPYPPSMCGKPMFGRDRIYVQPNKVASSSGMTAAPQFLQNSSRKDIIFPLDSIEATMPVLSKRRKLTAKDVSPLEAWRIMMALKSGLLAESTWALDVLSVLLYDDSTVLYFGLSHLPGLLEVLLEHYRRCLKIIFGLTGDFEVGYDVIFQNELDHGDNQDEESEKRWYEMECESLKRSKINGISSTMQIDFNDKTVILDKENYTLRTRCGKQVKVKPDDSLFLLDPERRWDCYEGFNSGVDHWQLGGGDITSHIQTHFENTHNYVRFVRVLDDVKSSERTDSKCSNSSEMSNLSDAEKDETSLEETTIAKDEDNEKDIVKEESNMEQNASSFSMSEVEDDKSSTSMYPKVRSMQAPRKRAHMEEMEDEAYNRDEPSLIVISDAQSSLARRCVCLSTLFRNLSFVPGNDAEMSKHAGFLLLTGRLLLLHHCHALRKASQRHYDQEEDTENSCASDSCSSLSSKREWWWDMLHVLRENTLVTLANITGQLNLAPYPEEISLPLLDGLLHWAVCPSTYAQDPLPSQQPHSVLSPQRLSIEALCKLSVLDSNVDLLLATPPWSRIECLFSLLSRFLSHNEDQVLREFSVVLLSNLAQADSTITRSIAMQSSCISQLIVFVEQAEQSALQVANSQGINALRKNPELMGTTLDMVRRAAGTLRCLAQLPCNRPLFLQHHQRLLALVMSQILDQGVASIIADVLYECSQDSSNCNSVTPSPSISTS